MKRILSNGWLLAAVLPLAACNEPYEVWEGSEWTTQRAFLDEAEPASVWQLEARNGADLQRQGADLETVLELDIALSAAVDETASGRRARVRLTLDEQTPDGGWTPVVEDEIPVRWGSTDAGAMLQLPVMDDCAPDRACARTWRLTVDSASGGVIAVEMSAWTRAEGTIPVGLGQEPHETRMDLTVERL